MENILSNKKVGFLSGYYNLGNYTIKELDNPYLGKMGRTTS
jgi:hypothetical protein